MTLFIVSAVYFFLAILATIKWIRLMDEESPVGNGEAVLMLFLGLWLWLPVAVACGVLWLWEQKPVSGFVDWFGGLLRGTRSDKYSK